MIISSFTVSLIILCLIYYYTKECTQVSAAFMQPKACLLALLQTEPSHSEVSVFVFAVAFHAH